MSAIIYLLEYISPKSCRFMVHTHLLGPHQTFQHHGLHMCRENEFLVRRLLIGRPATVCNRKQHQTLRIPVVLRPCIRPCVRASAKIACPYLGILGCSVGSFPLGTARARWPQDRGLPTSIYPRTGGPHIHLPQDRAPHIHLPQDAGNVTPAM